MNSWDASYSFAQAASSLCNSCITAMALMTFGRFDIAECATVPPTLIRSQMQPRLATEMRRPVGSASNAKSAVTPCVTRCRVPIP